LDIKIFKNSSATTIEDRIKKYIGNRKDYKILMNSVFFRDKYNHPSVEYIATVILDKKYEKN